MRNLTETHTALRRLLRAAMPVSPYGNLSSSRTLRLSPLLLAVAALVALAVFLVGDSAPPAQAQETTSEQTTSVYFTKDPTSAQEIGKHGLRYTEVYTVTVDPPLESGSAVHIRIKSDSTATEVDDYKIYLLDAPDTTATKVLHLPAGASRVPFGMSFMPDQETEGNESVDLELVAIEDAPYMVEDDFRSEKYRNMEVLIYDNSLSIPEDADPERGIQINPVSVMVGPNASDSYIVALASMPDSDVTVKAYLDEPEGAGARNIGLTGSEISVSPASLTFTSSNWSTPQTFTVSTNDATLGEYLILHGVEGSDPDYDTYQWFQGPRIDEERQIRIEVSVGGL